MFGDSSDCDEWPSAVISVANGLEPCGFNGVAGHQMKVADGVTNAGEFVHIVEILRVHLCVVCVNVMSHDTGVGHLVQFIEACMARGRVEEDGVGVQIFDVRDKWYVPELVAWATPSA